MRRLRSLLSPSWLLPLAVGAVSLGITAWLWSHERRTTERSLKAEFDFSVRQTASRIEQRMASYEQMLRGVQGLFQSSPRVEREDFERYVDALLAGADFAGIQWFGHAPWRPGPGVDGSARIDFVAPASSLNLKAVGDDPLADPVRRPALELAGDAGGLGITPRLAAATGGERDARPAFQMILPVYARGRAVDSAAARRAALAGWVVASVRMSDLMSSLYGEGTPGIEVRLYDGVDAKREALMYESSADHADTTPPAFEAVEYIGLASHTWTLGVSARPRFKQVYGSDSARIIALSGIGFSLLLALLTRQLVTGRAGARAAAAAATDELRASEERYRRIVETADEGILVIDGQGRTSFVNPKMARMLGRTVDEMIGRPLPEFLDETDPPAGAGGTADGARTREARFRRKDGSVLWASISTTPVADGNGQGAGALSMVTDISARKQADAARAELEAQLRESQKMQAIGTLAGGIAHDFNNILAAILGNVALARQPGLDAAAAGSLEQIGKSAARARSLVQQILAFSRRQPAHLVNQPLRQVIEESVRLLRPILPAGVELDLRLGDAALNVSADATQMHQVMLNLCTNAWHALEGRPGRITIGLEGVALDAESACRLGLAGGEHAHLWVSDTGCGMTEQTRLRIFEPFFTTKPVGQGTGLGLAVVHGIVATHHGAITVVSTPLEGSRFDLYFPLLAAPEPAPADPAHPAEAPHRPGRRLVYVDDDPVMVAMVQGLLERSGYRVTCFESPLDAMAELRARPDAFDLVVTDHNMPGLSGLEVSAELARLRPALPVVITSGYVSEELLAAAARAA
jgi:PAS domain S-box-containing protein